MSVTYMVATIGRPTLVETLKSIVCQTMPGDQVLVIGATSAIQQTAEAYGCEFFACPPGNDWGATERNTAVIAARGDYLAFIDDDDLVVPDSRVALESAIRAHPGCPLIFRMQYADSGLVLWSGESLRMGNIGTPMFVLPNDRTKLGTWGREYGGDFQFIASSGWAPEEFVWMPQIIARIRPQLQAPAPFAQVSVLVPTRKRLPQLRTLLHSFAATTPEDRGAELVFRVDEDDPATQEVLADYPWTVVIGQRGQGYRSLPTFFDEMRRVARGDLLMTGNDDMVFRTPNWADRVLAAANQYPDGVFALGVETYNAGNFPFAIVSARAVRALGHVHDPQIFWGDVYLRDVMAHFGRAIRLPDVQVDHCWMGFSPDETFREAKQDDSQNWDAGYWTLHRRCVAEAIAKLEAACLVAQ